MKNWQETHDIFKRLMQLEQEGRPAAVAVIVAIQGSTYRRPGAKLLIEDDGRMTGNVSGGCLENDVREAALEIMKLGKARLVHYDTSDEEDKLWGMGLGCNGEVDLLIQPFAPTQHSDFLSSAVSWLEGDAPFALGSAIRNNGALLASALVAGDDHRLWGEAGNDEGKILEDLAREAMNAGSARYEIAGDRVRFAEVLRPPPHLLVCGAGDDAIPLVRFASEAGFRVAVADHRRAYLAKERFPGAWRLVHARPEDDDVDLPMDAGTYAVIKTHVLVHDMAWVKRLLPAPISYIGLLGPRDRRDAILKEVDADDAGRMYGPAGLDLGGDGPEHVALSIVSEALCIWADRRPIHLRERPKAIHED